MEKRAWTARGEIHDLDKTLIRTLAGKNLTASRIFVTGEVHENYIGDDAVRLLVSVNDTLHENGVEHEPLFVQTNYNTIRMVRFDPAVVWRCFHPDTLVQLVEEEANRLHVPMDPRGIECFDFYEEMVRVIQNKIGRGVPVAWKDSNLDAYYSVVYLSCLLVFGKPGYLDLSVAQYFAQPIVADFMAKVDYWLPGASVLNELEDLRQKYCKIKLLTNSELNAVVSLYERYKV
jgi:hypothetical protein